MLVETYWELTDDGVLTLYKDVAGNPWAPYASQVKSVVVKPEVKTITNSAFAGYNIVAVTFEGTLAKIEAGAFSECQGLTQLVIPGTTAIEDYAFYNCDNLTDVVICGGLAQDKVGKNIFKSCDALKTVEVLNGAIEIGEGMFEDCVALESLILPDSICEIGRLAFENCIALKNIIIPDSTVELGDYAFHGCVSAETAYIGHNLAKVGEYAFGECTSLKEVEIKCAMPAISDGMFFGCTSLAGLAKLPAGVKTIGKNAFAGCTSFREIDIPDTVISIGDSAFDGTALETISIPASVDAIGKGAFTNCAALTAINVDNKNDNYFSVDGVLYEMTLGRLELCPANKSGEVTVWEGTSEIAADAFIGCNKLTKVIIPASVVSIGANAFNGCATTLVIKADCDSYAIQFAKGRGIATELVHVGEETWLVTVEPTCIADGEKARVCSACEHSYETIVIPATGHKDGEGKVIKEPTCEEKGTMRYTCVNAGCEYYHDEDIEATGHKYDDGKVVKEPTCEEKGTMRYTCVNADCGKFYDEDIEATGHDMDEGTVTLEPTCEDEGVITYACKNADCDHKTTSPIPATGHDYDNGVVIKYPTIKAKGEKLFTCKNAWCTEDSANHTYIEYIPTIAFDDMLATNDGAYVDEDGNIVDLTWYLTKAGDLYVFADGTEAEWEDYKALIKTAVIAKTVKTIGANAFMNCTALTSVSLAEGVQTLKKNAFKGCTALAEIKLPETLKEIGDSAFDATALKEIYIPADVDVIEKGAFTNCAALTAINVDNKNDNYFSVDGVLYEMSLATLELCPAGKSGEVTVWEGTKEIAVDAFIGCNKVTKINVPSSVTKIADNAFNGCATALVIKADCDSYAIEFAKGRGIATELVHVGEDIWKITLEPTCLADGAKERVCSACGYSYETVTILAIGHSYDNGVITTKPTCEAEGVVTFTCVNDGCDDSYTEAIPALQHNYNNGTVIVSATCEADGTRRFECQNDGCYDYYDVAIPAIGHNLDNGTVVTPVTCEADGEIVYKCTNTGCEYIETVVIPATGHNYKSEVVKPATCIDDGKIKYTCENCDNSYTESFAGEHKPYSEPQRTEPTCDTDGKEGEFCSICHQYIGAVTTIPATGHNYEDGKCTECGKSDGSVKPATPKLVKVGNTIHGPVIYWNDVDKADYYKIYALVDGKWTFVAIVNADEQNKYVDTKAVSGKTYTYSVSAVNGTLEGAYNKNGLTILFLDDPALKSIGNARTGVKVTWGKIKGATSYNVYRRTASSGWSLIKNVKTTSYVDTTAKSGVAYIYTVRARNGSTLSSYYANGINILFLGTPDVKSATAATNGVTVKWAKVSGAKVYRVYRKTGNGEWELLAKVSGSASSFKDKTAKSGKVYTYTVRAQNGSTKGAYETEGVKIKFLATPKLASAKASSKGITVKFGAVSGASGYRVYRKTANGSWQLLTTTKSTSYTDKTAKKGVTYTYTVRAVSGSYKSAYNTKGIACKAK